MGCASFFEGTRKADVLVEGEKWGPAILEILRLSLKSTTRKKLGSKGQHIDQLVDAGCTGTQGAAEDSPDARFRASAPLESELSLLRSLNFPAKFELSFVGVMFQVEREP